MFVILFVIFLAISILFAFTLNPVNVFLNFVQVVLGIVTIVSGVTAYFQGFLETAATGYFLASGFGWILIAMMRSRPVPVDY